jgi:hypothetical protein
MAAVDFTITRDVTWVSAAIAAALLLGVILWKILRREIPPEEVERRRRLAVNRRGKLGDGEVTDIESNTVFYSYSIGGVSYTAGQDLFTVEELLPEDRMSAIGPVLIKFDPRNPANSIVICEEWSGFQRGDRKSRTPRPAAR